MNNLAVFDLDYTVWPMNADQDVYPSLRTITNGVADGRGREVKLYPEIKQILAFLKENNVTIGIASKDCAPDLCREILDKQDILKYFDPGKTIFFDDNQYNIRELTKVGVHSVLVTQRH